MSAESLRSVLAQHARRWPGLDIDATANSLAATGRIHPTQLAGILAHWPDDQTPTAAGLARAHGQIRADTARARERQRVRPIIDQTRAALAAARNTPRRTT